MKKHINYFISILDDLRVLDQKADFDKYGRDRTKQFPVSPSLILFPKTTDDVQKILHYCNENDLPVVPSGGRTGLSAAAVASKNEIVISLEKMNQIIDIDKIGSTIEVEAGAILQSVQDAAEEAGMFFPLDFAAKGSALIGGCISTNAGGIKVIKYGMTRNIILGLEVVLMNGEILNLNRKLIKDNSGYDLRQLFIGAEGTLGIVTKASFQCIGSIPSFDVALFATDSFLNIPNILSEARKKSLNLSAFEFFTDKAMHVVTEHSDQLENPFEEIFPYYILIEIENSSYDDLEAFMEHCAEEELISEGTIGTNHQEFQNIWAFREMISESISMSGNVHKNDISIPVSLLNDFIPNLDLLIRTKYQEFELITFGHIADGNIHINILDKSNSDINQFINKTEELDEDMFRLVQNSKGSISAEHGIGLTKKAGLHYRRTEDEIELMKHIKAIFDPKGLMNPGKIF